MWLIDQGVTRDICNASLKSTWLERSPDSSVALHSFFPSDAPHSSEKEPAPLAGAEPAGEVTVPRSAALLGDKAAEAIQGVVVESKSRIRRSHGARRPSAAPGTGSKAWLVVTVLGAALSFSAALAYSLSSQPKKVVVADDEEPASTINVHQPSKDLGIATRRDLLPGAAPMPSLRLSDELDSLHEARSLAHNASGGKKAPAKPVTARPAAKKAPARKT